MDEKKRPRLRLDLPEDVIRAIKARAGLDGTDFTAVVVAALEAYLPQELTLARDKMRSEPATRRRKGQE